MGQLTMHALIRFDSIIISSRDVPEGILLTCSAILLEVFLNTAP